MAEKRGGRTVKKDWIKDAYRNWFNRLDEEVPEEVWEGVADELDIDEVWNNVQTELDRAEVIPWLRWLPRAAAVLLLLISALAAYWYLSPAGQRSEEHTSELQSLMRNSYAVFCLKK